MIDLRQLFALGLLTTSIHWLVARSSAGEVIWSRARGWFGRLLRCAGCSGWWLGLLLGLAGLRPLVLHYWWTSIVFSGLFGVILTPVFEGALLWGLRESAIEEEDPALHVPDNEDTTTPLDRPAPPQS
jgi:hypothetical protein